MVPDLTLHQTVSTRYFWVCTAICLFAIITNQVLCHTHAVVSSVPLAPTSPSWFHIIGYGEIVVFIATISLAANAAYNSILVATPDSPDADPVHMRSPILWGTLLQCVSGLAMIVAAIALCVRFR